MESVDFTLNESCCLR